MCPKYSNCSIVIPAYNEQESLGSLLDDLLERALVAEIIVVNDCSTDATKDIVQRFPQVILVNNLRNMGNGASVRKGILRATKEYVLLMDADGQHPPGTTSRLIDYTIEHEYDLVVASRKNNIHVSGFRAVGNRILEAFASFLAGTKIDDLTSGFRIFKRSSVMKILHLFPARYSYPTTSIMALLELGYDVDYLRIPEIQSRNTGASGIRPVQDFFRFIKIMLKITILYGPSKVFLPISSVLFVLGIVNISLTIYYQNNIQELGIIALLLSGIVAGFAIMGEQLAKIRMEIGVAVANEVSELLNSVQTNSIQTPESERHEFQISPEE